MINDCRIEEKYTDGISFMKKFLDLKIPPKGSTKLCYGNIKEVNDFFLIYPLRKFPKMFSYGS